MIFVGSGHKSFINHGQLGDRNSETLEARVTEIGLATQGMEDIISAIVQPQKNSSEWKENVKKYLPIFTWFSRECKRLDLFNWLPAPKIKNNIIENIYPMHPLATFSLLRLASEAGSDNRSVFKFFSPEFETGEDGWVNVQPYSYPWFIENFEIIKNNKLNLYTADYLIEYFRESLKADNSRLLESVKKSVVNYETTLRELNAYTSRQTQELLFDDVDELMESILKIMLVNEISSNHDAMIVNTKDNIHFGLNAIADDEKNLINDRLQLLLNAGILYLNKKGIYEFIPGDRKDVRRMVETYKANPGNKPTNLLQLFLDLNPLTRDESYLEARDYNSQYNEDKRLRVLFTTPLLIAEKQVIDGEELSYFSFLEHERKKITDGYNSYEGAAVYVFCENDKDINLAKKAISKNNQNRVVVAIPHNHISVYDALFSLKALDSDLFRKQAEDFNPYEKGEEKKIRDEALIVLTDAKNTYFSNKDVDWFGPNGEEIPVKDNLRHDAVNWMMKKIFGKTHNTIMHVNFNKSHVRLSGQVKAIFKEAGDILCPLLDPIKVNWAWPDNRGGTRYLRKCFIDTQILKITQIEGDIRYLTPEKESNKFSKIIPAYDYLLSELAKLKGKKAENPRQIFETLSEEYGQGEISITLMMLLARRYYGDSLRFKKEPANLTDIQFEKTEDMLAFVQGQFPSAVVLFEPVSKEDQSYFQIVYQIFNEKPTTAGKTFTIGEAYQAIKDWWFDLPIIARSSEFFTESNKKLSETISQAKVKDPYLLIKNDLLEGMGFDPREKLSKEKLGTIKKLLDEFRIFTEDIQNNIEKEIQKEFTVVFNAQSDLDVDIQDAMKDWFTGLSKAQKDQKGLYHNNDSKPLIKYPKYVNIQDLLTSTLPEAYGFGVIGDWTSNHVSAYIDRVTRGKEHIEKNAPQVSELKVEYKNEIEQHGDQVIFKGELKLDAKTDDGKGIIYYTDDNSDPTTSKQRKKLKQGGTLTVTGNRKLKLAVSDGQGNYSAIKTINAINDLEKYKIIRNIQGAFDESIMFIFPKDQEAAWVTITSLITAMRESGFFKKDELNQIILKALKESKE